MADPQDLVRHATAWAGGPAELNKIMADMSTLSESHHSLVAEAARALLLEASSGGHLNKYQCALCNVYAARGCIMHEREQAIGGIQHASDHLETLRETSKPFAALGIVEYPQMEALAAMIEELKRFWTPVQPAKTVEPIELPRHVQYCAPPLEYAQSLLDRIRHTGSSWGDTQAWMYVHFLGASHSYNAPTQPLWTEDEYPSAAGLLSDPNSKLINLLNRSLLPDGEGLDPLKLWYEVVRCEEVWWGDLAHVAGLGLGDVE